MPSRRHCSLLRMRSVQGERRARRDQPLSLSTYPRSRGARAHDPGVRLPTDGTRLVLVVLAAGGGGYKNRMATLRTQKVRWCAASETFVTPRRRCTHRRRSDAFLDQHDTAASCAQLEADFHGRRSLLSVRNLCPEEWPFGSYIHRHLQPGRPARVGFRRSVGGTPGSCAQAHAIVDRWKN